MDDVSTEPVKQSEPPNSSGFALPESASGVKDGDGVRVDLDRDFLCPICMQLIKDAFLTACGHSFCYMCIITHLRNKTDCPCCRHYITINQIFPNFLLDKLLKKTNACRVSRTASPVEQFRQALQEGHEVSVKELDMLLSLLMERKRKLEQEEAERNLQILMELLQRLKKLKLEEFNEIKNDLQYVKEDVNDVERRLTELCRAQDRYSVKLHVLADDSKAWSSSSDKNNSSHIISPSHTTHGGSMGVDFQKRETDGKAAQVGSLGPHRKESAVSGLSSQQMSQSGLAAARKKRVILQFNDLQECYLQKRHHLPDKSNDQKERDTNVVHREGYSEGLSDFQSVLTTFARYSRLRVIAEVRHVDLFHSANLISSIEFDRDDRLFATAGVSRSIKVFNFSSVVNEPTDVHLPVTEMSTRSKLSCLSWNRFTKNHIASSDYEGIVTVWDVNTRQSLMEYEEHEKRAWSVDFSQKEPSMLVSGSDDCKVKVWCTNQESSVLNIDMKANICCVKYNPGSNFHIAVGSADHHIHYYDLRNTTRPLHMLSGHKRTVSYVKFLSNNELASASTDSTLRLWDVKDNLPVRTFRGHTNDKNFVGLSVSGEFIASGSETNEVFVYHKAMSTAVNRHTFGSADVNESDEDGGSYFISAVCWKSDSPTMLAANSQGTIKVLVLAA